GAALAEVVALRRQLVGDAGEEPVVPVEGGLVVPEVVFAEPDIALGLRRRLDLVRGCEIGPRFGGAPGFGRLLTVGVLLLRPVEIGLRGRWARARAPRRRRA